MMKQGNKTPKRGKHVVKHHFTFMEILIVFSIILMVAGVIGINISKAIQKERFRTATDLILDKLQLAQDLMLILKTDVRIKFKEDPATHQLSCYLEVDKTLTKNLKAILNKNPEVKGIDSWAFLHAETQKKQTGSFTLEFFSGGTKMSQGELLLDSKDNHAKIVLPGYPKALGHFLKTSQEPIESHEERELSFDLLYPKEIQIFLQEEGTERKAALPPP